MDREKVPGWGGSEAKNTALVGSPQKDCCALGVLGMTSVWWRGGKDVLNSTGGFWGRDGRCKAGWRTGES